VVKLCKLRENVQKSHRTSHFPLKMMIITTQFLRILVSELAHRLANHIQFVLIFIKSKPVNQFGLYLYFMFGLC